MNTILRNDLIQGALIAYLKTVSAVTSKLVEYGTSSVEIREDTWQGDEFVYPNIRFRFIENIPENGDCPRSKITFSWMVFTEDQSSFAADEISGIITPFFHNRSFSYVFQGLTYYFSFTTSRIIPATHLGNIWRSEVLVSGFVSRS